MKMILRSCFAGLFGFLWFFATPTFAGDRSHQRIVLHGGGVFQPEVIKQFVDWAGGNQARILVITWAHEDSEGAFNRFRAAAEPLHPQTLENAPSRADIADKRSEFMTQLSRATGIFMTGGNQNELHAIITRENLANELLQRFSDGIVFGGSSAGTAIASERMFDGRYDPNSIDPKSVGIVAGLGLLAKEILVDQHFIQRGPRHNRMIAALFSGKQTLGIGIDAHTALAIEDMQTMHCLGESVVVIYDRPDPNKPISYDLLRPGETYDMVRREKIPSK